MNSSSRCYTCLVFDRALNYLLFRILIRLLGTEDPLVLAVAVHDLGQYVKHCERGKK